MILVRQLVAADNADVLAGTQLDQVPAAGTFQVLFAADTQDATIAITLGSQTIVDAQAIPMRTNGEPSMADDTAVIVTSAGGVRPVIAVLKGTATVIVIAVYWTQ